MNNRKLILSRVHSNFYEETIEGKVYLLKISPGWMWVNLNTTIKAYENYFNLENKNGLVKIHKVWEEEKTLAIRMEYLKSYITLRDWLKENHNEEELDKVMISIFKILSNLSSQGCLNVDCGDGNWMINNKLELKMIDLDTLVKVKGLSDSIMRLRSLGLGFLDLILKFNKCRRINE